jgi:hypothetical protein
VEHRFLLDRVDVDCGSHAVDKQSQFTVLNTPDTADTVLTLGKFTRLRAGLTQYLSAA